jgi:hypothetical protein
MRAPDLALQVEAGDACAEELDRLASRLRRELLELDVGDVRRAAGPPAPDGARALDVETVGGLVVSLVTAPEVLRAVLGTVRAWLRRSEERSVRIELGGDVIHLTGVSSAEQQRLIAAWLARQTRR